MCGDANESCDAFARRDVASRGWCLPLKSMWCYALGDDEVHCFTGADACRSRLRAEGTHDEYRLPQTQSADCEEVALPQ
jgi:hypothetical protein